MKKSHVNPWTYALHALIVLALFYLFSLTLQCIGPSCNGIYTLTIVLTFTASSLACYYMGILIARVINKGKPNDIATWFVALSMTYLIAFLLSEFYLQVNPYFVNSLLLAFVLMVPPYLIRSILYYIMIKKEPPARVELATSSLPRTRSTTELQRHK